MIVGCFWMASGTGICQVGWTTKCRVARSDGSSVDVNMSNDKAAMQWVQKYALLFGGDPEKSLRFAFQTEV